MEAECKAVEAGVSFRVNIRMLPTEARAAFLQVLIKHCGEEGAKKLIKDLALVGGNTSYNKTIHALLNEMEAGYPEHIKPAWRGTPIRYREDLN